MNPIRMIRNLIKLAKVVSVDDSGNLQFANVSMLGKEQRVMLLKQYGIMSNPPEGSLVTVFSQQGHESNGIGIADAPASRIFKDMTEGEVAIGNYETGDYVRFKDGNITEVSSTGTVAITGVTKITADAPAIELNGDTYHLTMYEQLNLRLQLLIIAMNSHYHVGLGPVSVPTVPFTLDISGAKADTLTTDG